jgi:hypothetical protein
MTNGQRLLSSGCLIGLVFFFALFTVGCGMDRDAGLTFENVNEILAAEHTQYDILNEVRGKYADVVQAVPPPAEVESMVKEGTVEAVYPSPDETMLAVVIDRGNSGKQTALYKQDHTELLILGREWGRVKGIRWEQEGAFVDFMVQNGNIESIAPNAYSFSLWRYEPSSAEMTLLSENVTRKQVWEWQDLL